MIFSVVLTEGRLHSDGGRLLRLLTEAVDVDSLDAEHVGLTWDQAVDHEPDRHRYFKLSSQRRSKQTRKQTAKIPPPPSMCPPPSMSPPRSPVVYLVCLKGLWLQGNHSFDPTTRASM